MSASKPPQKPGAPEPPRVIADIDRCVQTGIADHLFSAATVVASVGGHIFHRAAYGTANNPPPLRKAGFDTVFDLGALTNPLGAGLAALVLASRNRLDLNAALTKTIPEFRDARFAPIALDMLLEHTSGLPASRNFAHDLAKLEEKLALPHKTLGTYKSVSWFKKALSDVTLEYDPGTKVVYSDLGFLLLGWIVEHAVSQPLDNYLEREVYRGLGIAEDLFFVRHDDFKRKQRLAKRVFAATLDCPWRKKLLQGEVCDDTAWAMGGVAGHAGLFGTGDAVWKLVHALWESQAGQGRFFLGGTVRRFWTRSKRLPNTTRTLAWDTPTAHGSTSGKRFSLTSVGHISTTGCSIWVDLSTDIIGVVLTNAAHPSLAGKDENLAKFRARVYELIAKHGESLPPDPNKATGSKAFYSGPIMGTTVPLQNPLRKPR